MKPLNHLLPLLLSAIALPAQDGASDVVVLRGARVHTVSGAPIDDGVVILQAGKIAAVGGQGLAIPAGARVIDCAGQVVTPGLVDAATMLGLSTIDANEQGDEVTPQMRVLDALDPADKRFGRVRRGGTTTVQVSPGNRNVVGGLSAVIKTAGDSVADMLVRDESSLRVTMGGEPSSGNRAIRFGTPDSIYYRRPTTRMGVVWAVRKAFYDAMAYREEKTLNVGDAAATQQDAAMEVLLQALDGKVQVRTTAAAEQDIRTALRLAAEFGYKTVLEEATEAYRVVDELAAAKTTVVFGAPSRERGRDGTEARYHTLQLLAAADVPFAIATGSQVGSLSLAQEAMFAVRNGLTAERALAAVTLIPAKVLGVDDRVGSLEVGKDADVVVWNGDPFAPTSAPQKIFIDGKEVL